MLRFKFWSDFLSTLLCFPPVDNSFVELKQFKTIRTSAVPCLHVFDNFNAFFPVPIFAYH